MFINNIVIGTPEGMLEIPYLDIICGADISILIIEKCGSNAFIAQPFAPELVQLMKEMG